MFEPAEREIFEYFNGSRAVKADPDVVDRAFRRAMGEHDVDETFRNALYNLEELDEQYRAVYERDFIAPAAEVLLGAAREAFGVTALDEDGAGLTERESFALLFAFMDWKDAKKGPAATSPSSSPPSDGPPVAASTTGLTTGCA